MPFCIQSGASAHSTQRALPFESPQQLTSSKTLQLEDNEGYCFEMLKIASQENLLASRQLAAIQLKNIVKRRWNPSAAGLKKGIQPIPELDKKEIMANLHECVVRCAVHSGGLLFPVTSERYLNS